MRTKADKRRRYTALEEGAVITPNCQARRGTAKWRKVRKGYIGRIYTARPFWPVRRPITEDEIASGFVAVIQKPVIQHQLSAI